MDRIQMVVRTSPEPTELPAVDLDVIFDNVMCLFDLLNMLHLLHVSQLNSFVKKGWTNGGIAKDKKLPVLVSYSDNLNVIP